MQVFTSILLSFLIAGCASHPTTTPTNPLPDLPHLTQSTQNYIDTINGLPVSAPPTLDPSAQTVINGWAFDLKSGVPLSKMYVVVNGNAFEGRYGDSRPDVAGVFHNSKLSKTGYQAVIPPGTLSSGSQTLETWFVSADASGLYQGRKVVVAVK